ncbi:putative metallophosphoesterase [Pseudobythopirellula maris]|uniref:Putative metallophosphoesterase n=1 Tax=Pseudobythopirellula maris TaxID=2527991 RepID=A0A5C5ZT73_9BACT|nr:metallophosphoesterase [Pseudobythopirellula maris]TWT90719.1 putative metallophosphoesterase [Pseudobythopirellula maris]
MDWLLLLVALVGHTAIWVGVVNRIHAYGWPHRLVDALTLLSGILLAGIPPLAVWRGIVGETRYRGDALAIYTTFCVLMALWALLRHAMVNAVDRLKMPKVRRDVRELDLRETLGPEAVAKGLPRRLAAIPGNEILRPQIEELEFELERLPAELDGLKIAHLTDLHASGRVTVEYYRHIVEATNAWAPDVVVLTGDLVEHTPRIDETVAVLQGLVAPQGRYYLLGNHDKKMDHDRLRAELDQRGFFCLADKTIEVSLRGAGGAHAAVTLFGDERPWFGQGPSLPTDPGFTIGLVHTPDRFHEAADSGVDLVLAGHCHGGQIRFPLIGAVLCPSRHGVRYASGTFRRGRTVMHVSRGTGGLFPVRWNCPPELTLLTLRSPKSS